MNAIRVIQKIFLSLLTAVVIYSNTVIIAYHIVPVKILKIDPLSKRLFKIYSVFSAYSKTNRDYFLWAYTRDKATGNEQWERLPTHAYFPFKRGEQHSRMQMRMHKFSLSGEDYKSAQSRMMEKILAKYNREHTDKQALKSALTMEWWPKSRQAYELFHTPEMTQSYTIYREK